MEFNKEIIRLMDCFAKYILIFLILVLYYYIDENKKFPNDFDSLKIFCNKFLSSKGFEKNKLSDELIKNIFHNCDSELNTACSQIGGIISQEILKSISRDVKPIDNYFIFDGVNSFSGFIEKIE
jgi:hypothetical protein